MKAKLLSKQNRQLEKPLGSKLGSLRQAEGGEVIGHVPSDSTSAAWKWAECVLTPKAPRGESFAKDFCFSVTLLISDYFAGITSGICCQSI